VKKLAKLLGANANFAAEIKADKNTAVNVEKCYLMNCPFVRLFVLFTAVTTAAAVFSICSAPVAAV
jgi:hypothetical protein